MKLIDIDKADFDLWKIMRTELYSGVDDLFHEQEMLAIHKNRNWICRFIANDDGRKIGLVELSLRNIVDGCLSSPVAYLEGLYLAPDYRGQGVGKEVIKILLSWCTSEGLKELATDTELKNEKAQKFYQSIGFEEVDRVVEYRLEINKFK